MRTAPSLGKTVLLGPDTAPVIPAMARGDVKIFEGNERELCARRAGSSYAFPALVRRR